MHIPMALNKSDDMFTWDNIIDECVGVWRVKNVSSKVSH